MSKINRNSVKDQVRPERQASPEARQKFGAPGQACHEAGQQEAQFYIGGAGLPSLNHRRRSSYYSCQPSHQRSANIPVDHPPSVYLGEPVLHEAVVGFMSTALFGAERQDYWRRRLNDSGQEEETAPAHNRLKELQGEITDLERRIERQVANLEAEDATPSLRRRVGARIAELEEAVEERRQHANALAAQSADAPPTVADLTTAFDRLPLLAERLQDLPQPELRALFDSLQLKIAFQPQTRTIDVEVTLVADEQPDHDGERSQVWSVPLTGSYSNQELRGRLSALRSEARRVTQHPPR